MILPSGYLRVALLTALTGMCGGCAGLMPQLGPVTPFAEGTWTGRLMSVDVEDTFGDRHQAAALLIESGPRRLSSPDGTTGTIPEGTVPYLMKFGQSVIVDPKQLGLPEGARVETPTAFAAFPADIAPAPPKEWIERVFNLRRHTIMPSGGHFAALEEPGLLVEDIRAFFRPLRFGAAND